MFEPCNIYCTITDHFLLFCLCRLTKEKGYYEKEAVREEERYEKFKGEGADDHKLRKQVLTRLRVSFLFIFSTNNMSIEIWLNFNKFNWHRIANDIIS